ncbi:MAG: tetratricopeptide repeat protein [Planctomycetota bacterium]|jgi:predicted negative regulator of RcsB-dependent stress response
MKLALNLTVAALFLGGLVAQVDKPAGDDKATEQVRYKAFDQKAFEDHMRKQGATDAQIEAFRVAVEAETAKYAVEGLLREVFSDYAKAAKLADDAEPAAALELAKVLTNNKDPYVKAYSRYQLARFFLDTDEPDDAAQILAEFVEHHLEKTPLDAEVIYFYGHALAQIPDRERAILFFHAFLREFKNAPERLRASAAQILAELEQQEGVLHEISDIMKNVERKIRKTDTGKETQEKQKHVIDWLEKIIEMMEQQQQSGGPPGGAGGIRPAKFSALPGGEGKTGPLRNVKKVADKWGKLKDAERKSIEAELKSKMPSHYKKMLEEFYKKLGKTGTGG